MDQNLNAKRLLDTERGKNWLSQFVAEDQEIAERIVSSLTLVSHSEFERSIQSLLEKETSTRRVDGPLALYAVREIRPTDSYFVQSADSGSGKINALTTGSDHGSEARVAALIRNFCKTDEKALLNHPNISEMRAAQCRTIILIDDFIGSGERVAEFISSFWSEASIASWHSLKYFKFIVVAYSATESGLKRIAKHKAHAHVVLQRGCPSFLDMPWRGELKKSVINICKKYGQRTSMGYWWSGYGRSLTTLIFEHSCPDNAPAILWAPNEPGKPWSPLFPDRVVLAVEKSIFPPEISSPDMARTLIDVGQRRLALSGSLVRRGKVGRQILLVLALIAKGQRKQIAISFAIGLSERECAQIVEKCKKWGFISSTRRLTKKGLAELTAAKKIEGSHFNVLQQGDESYYPKQLRGAMRD